MWTGQGLPLLLPPLPPPPNEVSFHPRPSLICHSFNPLEHKPNITQACFGLFSSASLCASLQCKPCTQAQYHPSSACCWLFSISLNNEHSGVRTLLQSCPRYQNLNDWPRKQAVVHDHGNLNYLQIIFKAWMHFCNIPSIWSTIPIEAIPPIWPLIWSPIAITIHLRGHVVIGTHPPHSEASPLKTFDWKWLTLMMMMMIPSIQPLSFDLPLPSQLIWGSSHRHPSNPPHAPHPFPDPSTQTLPFRMICKSFEK